MSVAEFVASAVGRHVDADEDLRHLGVTSAQLMSLIKQIRGAFPTIHLPMSVFVRSKSAAALQAAIDDLLLQADERDRQRE